MSDYPDAEITEGGIKIGEMFIPEEWIEVGGIKARTEWGYSHRLTVTVFVDSLTIRPGVEVELA